MKNRQSKRMGQTGARRVDRRAAEEALWAIEGMTKEREFDSEEDFNAFLQQKVAAQEFALIPSTALEKAQKIMFSAFEAPRAADRTRMALEALETCPDCADAYVLLAEEEEDTREQRRLYGLGVEAGERALGPDAFSEFRGRFWGVVTTRPYMRAKAGLARTLWELGEREEALAHYREMLELNPGDNQGNRYLLLQGCVESGLDEEAWRLLREHEDGSVEFLFTKALLLFRMRGDTKIARQTLANAAAANVHVLSYLLGHRTLPRRVPESYTVGSEEEAIGYVSAYADAWTGTPGMMDFVITVLSDAIHNELQSVTRRGLTVLNRFDAKDRRD